MFIGTIEFRPCPFCKADDYVNLFYFNGETQGCDRCVDIVYPSLMQNRMSEKDEYLCPVCNTMHAKHLYYAKHDDMYVGCSECVEERIV